VDRAHSAAFSLHEQGRDAEATKLVTALGDGRYFSG